MRQGFRHGLVMVALVAASACQAPQATPPSAALRQSLGTIAVSSSGEPALAPVAPPDAVGAGSGAAQGALAGFGGSVAAGGSPGGNLFTLALGIALAPVAGIVGAAVGAAKAHSEEEVATAQTQLATVWSKAKPTANLTAAFLERSQGMGWQTLAADDGATPMLVSTASGTGTAVSPNTKLRIGVEALELVYDGNFDPDVYVMMRTFARFSTVADDAELFRAKWTVVRKGAPYFTLAQRPQALQTQIDEVTATAAGSMANFLFAASSPVDARQEAHGGTILIEATTVALPSTPAAP